MRYVQKQRYSRRLPYKIPGATHERYSGCDVISNYTVMLTHIHSIILDEKAYCYNMGTVYYLQEIWYVVKTILFSVAEEGILLLL